MTDDRPRDRSNCAVLRSLAENNAENQASIAKEGAFPKLIWLLNMDMGNPDETMAAVKALTVLAGNAEFKADIVAEVQRLLQTSALRSGEQRLHVTRLFYRKCWL